MPVRKLAAVCGGALVSLLLLASTAVAAPVIDGHFPIPPIDGSNAKIVAGPDGNMWLPVNDGAKDVARIAPNGAVEEFELNGIENPSGIAVGPEKLIWVTAINQVASFSPADPKESSKAFTIATVTANNPIVAGPDGQMWVAATDNVVHFLPSDPEKAQAYSVAELSPKDIDVAGSGLVIADAGHNRIVTMTTSGVAKDIPLLGTTTTAQGVAGAPNGQIAFSKSDGSEGLGLVSPPAAPTAVEMAGDPFGVALGSDGAYYFAMSAADNVQRFTADGKAAPLNGLPPEFRPRQIAPGPNNTMWVTMEFNEGNVFEVARISGLEPPKPPAGGGGAGQVKPTAPGTTIAKGPKKKVTTKGAKATVSFRFGSTTAGATFECALVKKPAKKGRKAPNPKFAPCTSPKKLKLKPGKYTFSVRAVSAGLTDPTAATSSFRVVHVR